MAEHTKLTENNYALVRAILKTYYGNSSVNFDTAQITGDPVGRLSLNFFITGANGMKLFAKMSRSGSGYNNIPLSMHAFQEAKLHGIPCPAPLKGMDGKVWQTILHTTFNDQPLPTDMIGQTLIITDYHEKKEIPSSKLFSNGQATPLGLEMLRELGRYNAELLVRLQHLASQLPQEIQNPKHTSDPWSIDKIRESLQETFRIAHKPADMTLAGWSSILANNLSNSMIGQHFKNRLQEGMVEAVFQHLDTIAAKLPSADALPSGWDHNDIKPNNCFMVADDKEQSVQITTAYDFDNIGIAPNVKSLGRTLALNCFDANTGEFLPEYARAMLEGFLERKPLSEQELGYLNDYIITGTLESVALRSSYFANELAGLPDPYTIDKIDPSIHLKQIASLEAWNKENRLSAMVKEINDDTTMKQHHALSEQVDRFMHSDSYWALRNNGRLADYFAVIDAVHHAINGKHNTMQAVVTQSPSLLATLHARQALALTNQGNILCL